jgi:hypothetical protein
MKVLYVYEVSVCICKYFSIPKINIPTHTDIYLHILTYLIYLQILHVGML